jgi:hypothetical protein
MDPVCGFPQGEGQGVIELSGNNCGLQGCHCDSMDTPMVNQGSVAQLGGCPDRAITRQSTVASIRSLSIVREQG